jgi:phosphoribosyl-ATP pyrophosphohydrolase
MKTQEILTSIQDLAIDVAEGNRDPLEVFGFLQVLRKEADKMEKAVKEEAMETALALGVDKAPTTYKGLVVKFVPSRTTYKYDHIGPWKEIESRKKYIEELAKLAAKKGTEQVDEETGELIPSAHSQHSKEGLSISLA